MTYLPDFVGKNFIIECKGLVTDSFPLRWKIFKYYLKQENKDYKLFLVKLTRWSTNFQKNNKLWQNLLN